jgi:hypothetical protein
MWDISLPTRTWLLFKFYRQLWTIYFILQDSQLEDTVSFPMRRRKLMSKLCNSETKPKGGILFGGKLQRSEQIGLNCKMGVWIKVCIFSKNINNGIKVPWNCSMILNIWAVNAAETVTKWMYNKNYIYQGSLTFSLLLV